VDAEHNQLDIIMGNNTSRINPIMRIPVPWAFAIAYLAGIGIQLLVPVTISSGVLLTTIEVLGILITAVGVVLMAWPQSIFRRHHTTTVPSESTSTFVTWGPYRFSRTPMYLGLFLFFAGISVIFALVWSILLLFVVVYYLNSILIPVEERQLRRNFGEAYEQYCKKVRRWI
jgi:protein-S-isoprenylcysteine O-methyltransferase Ste14